MDRRGHVYTALSWLIALLALSAGTSFAQATAPPPVPTVSRLVVQFTARETELAARLRARDALGAGQLLTDDFELRAGSQPGRPVPRAEFIRQSIQSPTQRDAPAQMAVHDLGDTMAVSFLQPAGGANADLFIVDVWRRAGDEWKLAIRYVAPASPGHSAAQGIPPEPPIRKKY
jgi:hypothetical protein